MENVAEQRNQGAQVHGYPKVATQMDGLVKKPLAHLLSVGQSKHKSWNIMVQLSKSLVSSGHRLLEGWKLDWQVCKVRKSAEEIQRNVSRT